MIKLIFYITLLCSHMLSAQVIWTDNIQKITGTCDDLLKKKQTVASIYLQNADNESLNKLAQFTELEFLTISGNLDTLPASLGKLSYLRKLHLITPKLNHVDPALAKLKQLSKITLDSLENPLCILQVTKGMASVEEMEITNCKMPSSEGLFSGYSQLEQLKIWNCGLLEFPEEICSLPSLTALTVKSNRIKGFPSCLLLNNKIGYADLSKNEISAIPAVPAGVQEERIIDLKGNPIPFKLKKERENPVYFFD